MSIGASLRDRAGGLKPRAALWRLGLSALIPCAVALGGCSRSVFVWTFGDIFALAIFGFILAVFLLLLAACAVQSLVRAVRRKLSGGNQ